MCDAHRGGQKRDASFLEEARLYTSGVKNTITIQAITKTSGNSSRDSVKSLKLINGS